ncbi:hypothetical protein NQZ79_g6168 [Umbelopsis isabellina]|nr:hypothetical protein NQZ79_g6168 [Umbelopsis isabellina]
MTPESFQRSKLAFIRHKQVPRSKLVRAPPPVRHTDKAPCMRDTLSAYSAGDTISITRQSKKSLLNAFPSGHIAITNNPPNSTGLSAGLSLSCQSQPSLHSKNAICRTVALLDVHLSENNVKDAKSIFSEHSDLIPAKSAHPEKQSVEVEVTDVEATDIESCNYDTEPQLLLNTFL